MNLGIYAPYDRGEVTTAAMQVAELALALAFDVRWLSPAPVVRGIHPYWDQRVVGYRKPKQLYQWAYGCQYPLWFEPHEQHLKQARLVNERRRHTLVPMWHRISQAVAYQVCLYDKVIASSINARKQIVDHLYCEDSTSDVYCCLWDSGLNPVRKPRVTKSGNCRILVPLDSFTLDHRGPFVLRCLRQLLANYRLVEFTLLCDKSWSRQLRHELRELQTAYAPRLTVLSHVAQLDRLAFYHNHDWTFIPSIRSNTGLQALQSMACGTPVIAYDINPFSEIICNGQTGLLIECDLSFNWLQAPVAEPHMDSTVSLLEQVIRSPLLCQQICREDWQLLRRQANFAKFWAYEWDVEL